VIGPGIRTLAHIATLLATLVLLTSCGSGGVGMPPVTDPDKITVLPLNATMYSGLPTTFSITGGTGAYIVSSSNQAIVPVASTLVGSSITIVPNPVLTDTTLTLTARDTGTTAPTSVTLTVKPGTVSNSISIAPSSTACAPALCSGGDAVISAVISQGGTPLAARGVRFEAVSGDFMFITSPANAPETLANSVLVATDETGTARARIRASSSAPNQTGILQVTDIASGAYQRTSLIIAASSTSDAAFFTVPTAIDYTGPDNAHCAGSTTSAPETSVFIFGGAPPYTISNSAPGAFAVNTSVVGASGGSFRVSPQGPCVTSATIAVTDLARRTITVTLSNKLGTSAPVVALAVTPASVSLATCTQTASATITGGAGTYVAADSSGELTVTVSGSLITVKRAAGSPAPSSNSIPVTVSDGTRTTTLGVNLTGTGAGPPPGALNACP
jgi:hypothetical protein